MDLVAIIGALESHALALGRYESVNRHEPKSPPPTTGLHMSIFLDAIQPGASSGLASTSAYLIMLMRAYTGMISEPQDDIDINVAGGMDKLIEALVGDFTLGGRVRNIDVRGQHGRRLEAQAGYLNLGGPIFRVATLSVPMIINDVWPEVP